MAVGKNVFESVCAQCHGDGHGDAMNPPLIGSTVLAGPPVGVIDSILHGRRGEIVIEGRHVNGIMPSQDSLTDEEIAAVVTYVRATFANQCLSVAPAEVAKVRSGGQ